MIPGLLDKREILAPGAFVLHSFVRARDRDLASALEDITAHAPFRHMVTPGGHEMSVAMTNCGIAGRVTDARGYRYDPRDPVTGLPWPAIPASFLDLAWAAASEAGYQDFVPDACLINRYEPGARLTLHQDRNERDLAAPIVSVSLGLPARFLFGGLSREDRRYG